MVRASARGALPAILLCLGLAGEAAAETRRVILKNGDDLYGEVTLRGDFVEVLTPGGQRKRFARADVVGLEGLEGVRSGAAAPSAAASPASEPTLPDAPVPPPEPVPTGERPSAPPASPLLPWYVRQKYSLLAAAGGVAAFFAAGVARGEHSGILALLRRMRILLLLFVLTILGIYAVDLQTHREGRRGWTRPLHVAVVLVERQKLSPMTVEQFRNRAMDAAEHMYSERLRYRSDGERPFWFHVYGPVPVGERPPTPLAEGGAEGLYERLSYGLSLRRYLSGLNDAAGLDGDRFDARMYVFATPPMGAQGRFVEGQGESGGELGTVDVDLDLSMIDAAWIAVAHETLHTVGATDKYDDAGRSEVPDGLPEPNLQPLYPQRFAEIMAGEVALSPNAGRLVDSLRLVRVGAFTAQEIGW